MKLQSAYKKLNTVFLFLFSIIFISSCSTDEPVTEDAHHGHREVFKIISFEEFRKDSKAFEQYKEATTKKSVPGMNSRMVALDDFYIDNEEIYYIDFGFYKSYTFSVYRDHENPGVIENMVIAVFREQANVVLLEYYFSEEDKVLWNRNIAVDLKGKIGFKGTNFYVDLPGQNQKNKLDDCLEAAYVGGDQCPSCSHNVLQMLNGQCSYVNSGEYVPNTQLTLNIKILLDCLSVEGGGGIPPSGINFDYIIGPGMPGNGNGGGGGGGGHGNPGDGHSNPGNMIDGKFDPEKIQNPGEVGFITTPKLTVKVNVDPCNQMKQFGEKESDGGMDMKPVLDNLIDFVTSGQNNHERGYDVQRRINEDETHRYDKNYVISSLNAEIEFIVTSLHIGTIHTHPDNGYSMFSYGDLKSLLVCYDIARDSPYTSRKEYVFSTVVCKGPDNTAMVYTLKVSDVEKLRKKVNDIWDLYSNILDENDRLIKINEDEAEEFKKNKNDLEKFFLQSNSNSGIRLFKARDNSFKNWDELKLSNTAPLRVEKIPCN